MARTAALSAAAGALLAWCWLRLESPHVGAWSAAWIVALAIAPALLPRPSWRLAALVPAAALAAHAAFGVWFVHPLRLAGRFGNGFLEFYDVKLPFSASGHPRMEGVILVALFASTAAVALVVAARRPVGAAVVVVCAAGWPATLLTGPDDLSRGAWILAVALLLLVGLEARLGTRRFVAAAGVGAVVVIAALSVSRSTAVASGQVLRWQNWDFYTKPERPVGVQYVWSSSYGGLRFPKKVTPVLQISAPNRPTYWRATTLDEFDGGNWYENARPVEPLAGNGRDELVTDPEFPPAAGNSDRWVRQDVRVLGLHDNHLIGASVPVAYSSRTHLAQYGVGGIALLQDRPIGPGDTYTVWSFQAQPTPQQLARLKPRYPRLVLANDLYVEAREVAPPFGAPDREARVEQIFAESLRARQYRGVYETAKRVVGGNPPSPYAAALELEAWFRSGAFRYDETPPPVGNTPALVAFVMRTHAGYCQHFAGAMALMLRYLGIPARVAAGFTSGTYDANTHAWTVTDHDAHTWVEAWFPRYGWLPFDPTPGRGNLNGAYTASSPHFDLSDGLRAVASTLQRPSGSFDLRKLQLPKARKGNGKRAAAGAASGGSSGTRIGSLLELLVLVGLATAIAVAALKLAIRKRRYLTRDPRRLATAYVRELEDFVADQGASVPPSATLRELADVVEAELGVAAQDFASAAAAARYGPVEGDGFSLRRLRAERRALWRELRRALSRSERALGLVSLRSLGLTG